MKNLIVSLTALVVILASCSKSSDTPVVTPPTSNSTSYLLKKFIVTGVGSSNAITTDITYNGNKFLKSVSSDGTSKIFTYTGDLITKAENFDGTFLDFTDNFSYNTDGKLASYTELTYTTSTTGTGIKTTFIYNANGTISYTTKTGNLIAQNTLSGTGTATLTNGEVTKIEKYSGSSTTNPNVITYTYDGKNSQFKNVTGYSASSFIDEIPDGFTQNVLKVVNTQSPSENETNTYTYNSDNFPLTKGKVSTANGTYNVQFFY